MKWLHPMAALAMLAAPVRAQSEAVLKDYFEGKMVTVKLDMPGAEEGVDIYPSTARPLDYPKYAGRLKKFGTAIKAGQPMIVTKLKVKKDHVEFQLGGGGYGTSGDDASTNVDVSSAPKTEREKNVERLVKNEPDEARKRELKEELDALRKEREREDARNSAATAEAEEKKKENVRQRRVEGGSRFNLRYQDAVPAAALTPEGVKQALAPYVEFRAETFAQDAPAAHDAAAAHDAPAVLVQPVAPAGVGSAASGDRAATVRKGMLMSEVERMLGRAKQSSERTEGTLKVVSKTYVTPESRVTAEFVEGVLIRFSITSN